MRGSVTTNAGGTFGAYGGPTSSHAATMASTKTNMMELKTPYGTTPIVEGTKNVSLLKAELVRNNLVTRSDLMKLY